MSRHRDDAPAPDEPDTLCRWIAYLRDFGYDHPDDPTTTGRLAVALEMQEALGEEYPPVRGDWEARAGADQWQVAS